MQQARPHPTRAVMRVLRLIAAGEKWRATENTVEKILEGKLATFDPIMTGWQLTDQGRLALGIPVGTRVGVPAGLVDTEGETVTCPCGKTTRVKLAGTMPPKWYGVWDLARPEGNQMIRCCSEECGDHVKRANNGRAFWPYMDGMVDIKDEREQTMGIDEDKEFAVTKSIELTIEKLALLLEAKGIKIGEGATMTLTQTTPKKGGPTIQKVKISWPEAE